MNNTNPFYLLRPQPQVPGMGNIIRGNTASFGRGRVVSWSDPFSGAPRYMVNELMRGYYQNPTKMEVTTEQKGREKALKRSHDGSAVSKVPKVNYIFFDLETSRGDRKSEILQIGAVDLLDDEKQFNVNINPKGRINFGASKVNGFTIHKGIL